MVHCEEYWEKCERDGLDWCTFESAEQKRVAQNYILLRQILRNDYHITKFAGLLSEETIKLAFLGKYESIFNNIIARTAELLNDKVKITPYILNQIINELQVPIASKPIDGVFNVIYADPPWQYRRGTTTPKRTIEHQYKTMDLGGIKSYIKDKDIKIAKDAVLFLWSTSPFLEDALKVLNAWGFDYRSSIIWDKERMGLGHWVRIQHEQLLIGRRGNMPPPKDDATQPRSVIREKSLGHSKKPLVVYDIIEGMYPSASRLELFARTERAGWTSRGDELQKCL